MVLSGIEEIEAKDGTDLHIAVNNGSLIIEGVNGNQGIVVYDMQGRVVYSGTARVVENLPSGLYIVRTGSQSAKIAI